MCKFYQGVEDKTLEKRLKALFGKVHREKPESSRSVGLSSPSTGFQATDISIQESKEAYFVATRRKADIPKEVVFVDG